MNNIIYLICLLSITAGGCRKNSLKSCSEGYQSIDYDEIKIGCCIYDEPFIIINDDATYRDSLDIITTGLPSIDFSAQSLIGVFFDGQCSEKCYELKKACKNDAEKKNNN